jgi:hypothetical protein
MASKITKQVGGFLIVTFALWYLLRRTSLGSAYARDMWSIPQHIGIAEGLQSAQRYLGGQI